MSFALCPVCLRRSPVYRGLCAVCRGYLPHRNVRSRRLFLAVPAYPPVMAIAAFRYQAPLPRLVRQFKFHEQLQHAPWMGAAAGRSYLRYRADVQAGRIKLHAADLLEPTVVLPLPLHPRRQRERGYNQAEALAAAVASELALPMKTDGFYRVKETGRQSEMSGREGRSRNLKDAFAVRASAWRGERVLLVDDVSTTGASLQSAAEILEEAGAYGVLALVVASNRAGFDEILHPAV